MDSFRKFEKCDVDERCEYSLYYWFMWLPWTVISSALLIPTLLIISVYISACLVQFYRLRKYFISDSNDLLAINSEFIKSARIALATIWNCLGRIWHGYEVVGLENLPLEGPALVVYYHGSLPVDHYYLIARCFLEINRPMWSIAADFLFRIPGIGSLLIMIQAFPGTVQQVANLLKAGHVVSVAPGGIREAQFSDETYKLVWNGHLGFAKAACQGKAPIIPVFTQNIREAFRTFPYFRGLFRVLYERTKWPLLLVYGGFPVKLRAVIGKPIPYDEKASPEEVAEKTAQAIRDLIKENQIIPGSVTRALLDRFR